MTSSVCCSKPGAGPTPAQLVIAWMEHEVPPAAVIARVEEDLKLKYPEYGHRSIFYGDEFGEMAALILQLGVYHSDNYGNPRHALQTE